MVFGSAGAHGEVWGVELSKLLETDLPGLPLKQRSHTKDRLLGMETKWAKSRQRKEKVQIKMEDQESLKISWLYSFFCCLQGMWESSFPDQGLNLCPMQWKHELLTTGPRGKSPGFYKILMPDCKNKEGFLVKLEKLSWQLPSSKSLRKPISHNNNQGKAWK